MGLVRRPRIGVCTNICVLLIGSKRLSTLIRVYLYSLRTAYLQHALNMISDLVTTPSHCRIAEYHTVNTFCDYIPQALDLLALLPCNSIYARQTSGVASTRRGHFPIRGMSK